MRCRRATNDVAGREARLLGGPAGQHLGDDDAWDALRPVPHADAQQRRRADVHGVDGTRGADLIRGAIASLIGIA